MPDDMWLVVHTIYVSAEVKRGLDSRIYVMPRILLLDRDERHARELGVYLEGQHHTVKVYREKEEAFDALKRDPGGFEVVILHISGDRHEDWDALDYLRSLIKPGARGPLILLTSSIYQGPRAILKAERKGARLVHEQ